MDAVDNDLMKDGTHSSMSINRPNRQSRVTIGGTQSSSNQGFLILILEIEESLNGKCRQGLWAKTL